jgi:hypothetical protein
LVLNGSSSFIFSCYAQPFFRFSPMGRTSKVMASSDVVAGSGMGTGTCVPFGEEAQGPGGLGEPFALPLPRVGASSDWNESVPLVPPGATTVTQSIPMLGTIPVPLKPPVMDPGTTTVGVVALNPTLNSVTRPLSVEGLLTV